MRYSPTPVGIFLMGLLLVGCSQTAEDQTGMKPLEENPLAAEVIADQMLDYVAEMQIRADERKKPITDPTVLRVIDDTFIEARRMEKQAHARQDAGKRGGFYGVNDNFAIGSVLLEGEMLYFGYTTEIAAAPGMELYLAQHVAPQTIEEFLSEPVKKIGPLKNIYGIQQYHVGSLTDDEWNKYRTVVIFSKPLNTIIALAQIRGVVK
jgi:hypothetical protein